MKFFDEYFQYNDKLIVKPNWNGNPLLWNSDIGVGYLKSNGYAYSEDYWETYQKYGAGTIGEKLTNFRAEFVGKHFSDFSKVCDVGIGSGQFVKHVGSKGYDINPFARDWLEKNGSYADPYLQKFDALIFWDVLEHFDDPSQILETTDRVFLSAPIHANLDACYASKHLKPNEHIWHFTNDGMIFFMKHHGFELIDSSDGETQAGRESIMSYYFIRK